MNTIRLHESDTVVTATRSMEVGTLVEGVTTTALIPSGHKIATQAMVKGDAVRKYAQLIRLMNLPMTCGPYQPQKSMIPLWDIVAKMGV